MKTIFHVGIGKDVTTPVIKTGVFVGMLALEAGIKWATNRALEKAAREKMFTKENIIVAPQAWIKRR